MPDPLIGIIAEDDSDVACIKKFIIRNHPNRKIGFKKFVGQGCGKISRKANAWAQNFKTAGCNSIILLHDLDRNDRDQLYTKICTSFLPSPIKKYCICIPTEEMEAWLLSDEDAFKKVFNLKGPIKLPLHPETVESPKEYIGRIVRTASERKVDYLNTKHNEKIAELIDLDKLLEKCPTYNELKIFIDLI